MTMKGLVGRTILGVALFVAGCGAGTDEKRDGSIRTIPGTRTWDVDANRLVDDDQVDFFWQHVGNTERCLVPKNGAKAAAGGHDVEDGDRR